MEIFQRLIHGRKSMETKDYTQYGEQAKITEFFGTNVGRFLDVGAADGITYSNVYNLLLTGWSGLSIEPEAQAFHTILQNYKQFGDRATLLNAVISTKEEFVKFYSHGQLSTTSNDHIKKWEDHLKTYNGEWNLSYSYSVTLNNVMAQFGTDYDFVSIDIEGRNYDLVASINWNDLLKCKLVCIEHDSHEAELLQYMKQYGFTEYFVNPVNLIVQR